MLLYLAFTLVWTFIVISQSAILRRIDRRTIRPFDRMLAHRRISPVIRWGVMGLLKLSMIPLGIIWASLLLLRSLRTA